MENNENNIVSIRQAPKFDENPFIESSIKEIESNCVIKQRFGTRLDQKGIVATVDPNSGEIFQTSFLRRVEIDEDQFTKLYIKNLGALNDLSNAGIRVLNYIMSIVKPNAVDVIIRREKCMEFCKYKTLKPIYKGLAELVNAQIIARSWSEDIFFINPLVLFNGNRIVFATEWIKKKNPNIKSKTLNKAIESLNKIKPSLPDEKNKNTF